MWKTCVPVSVFRDLVMVVGLLVHAGMVATIVFIQKGVEVMP